MPVWRKSSQRLKRYFSIDEIFTHVKSSCDLENKIKVTKIYSTFKLVSMIYSCKFGEISFVCSRDMVGTRKCHLMHKI